MTLQEIAALGEIIGALGVVASLVYLATQIRNQNLESRLAAITTVTTQWNSYIGAMAENGELARIWVRGLQDFGALDEIERVRLSTHLNRILRAAEGMHRQYRAGKIDDELWQGISNALVDFVGYPGVKTWWPTRRHWYTADFRTLVESSMQKAAGPAAEGAPG